jgi:hypothetical protein
MEEFINKISTRKVVGSISRAITRKNSTSIIQGLETPPKKKQSLKKLSTIKMNNNKNNINIDNNNNNINLSPLLKARLERKNSTVNSINEMCQLSRDFK